VPRLPVLALVAALSAAPTALARADIEGSEFESNAWRVRMTAPKNWQLTEKAAYPNILLRLSRRTPDGKMMLTAERLSPGTDALAYAERTAAVLRGLGVDVRSPQLHSSTGAYLVDAERGGAALRQAFLVAGGIGYSLTLYAPDNRSRSQHLRAFDYALRSIQVLRPGQGQSAPAATSLPAPPAASEGAGANEDVNR